MQISNRMQLLGTETAFEVLERISRFPDERRENVISFAIGEPDFDTPEHIKQAAIESINSNRTHYTPSAGIMPLREAIATFASESRHMTFTPENVTVLPSAKFIIFLSLATCMNRGDEVIYPNPGYPIYESLIRTLGGNPVPAWCQEKDSFNYNTDDLRNLITDKTSMLIINTPQNPTGSVLSDENIVAIAEMALEHDLWVLADEIYSDIIFDGLEFKSIAQLPNMQERTIILDGYSKYFAMTGWRLGYALTNPEIASHFSRWATNTVSCTATFVQDAGVVAMKEPKDSSEAMVREFQARRDITHRLLNEIEGISAVKPRGAFYIFANVSEACEKLGFKTSLEFQDYILEKCDVAVLSRTYFGSKPPQEREHFVRLSYCISREQITEGLARVKEAVEGA
ncbi:aminotransferase class I/II-fold pyridoxal phosphate-dependent enzyme [Candidatus Bathyarchaeota archaeon]|nr:aminotransferase class I/II-fold pyridoxal phosphate-dependent enzyme [Candidatus Bathyarchaeota archaeon]